ncbi:MAG: NAD(P)/FAD-dependent oxidoreductase [Paludibacteraceae bacterium]|nr:NAD(P)/FAD-dependent oxidoreductase [Paludibacteraceae bacterium]
MKHDVVIIGGGLGGLLCAYILAKSGRHVCVLEQNQAIGGCLQSFKRNNLTFDTGFHYIGGLEEGQSLHNLFRYFNLLHLPWQKLDTDCFDEIILQGKKYQFANGHERFVETLSQAFPHQKENLQQYSRKLQEIGSSLFDNFKGKAFDFYESPYFTQSAKEFLDTTIDDENLKCVLAGASLKMQLDEHLPLYIYAQINNSFIESAWRIKGGGMQIAESLVNDIRKMGGDVFCKQKVTQLVEENGVVKRAIVNHGEADFEADFFISDAHPARTNEWLEGSKSIRNIYRNRIKNAPNSFGIFTTHLQLKEGRIPYRNCNHYIYETNDLWHISESRNEGKSLLVNYQVPQTGEYTRNIDLLTPMSWEEVKQWEGTAIGQRGDDYQTLKKEKAALCIALAAKHIPGIEEAIEKVYTSTPLTYHDYTGTQCGAAYGIQKDHNRLLQTILPTQTPIKNLFQTGQNINLHGILGVSITALLSCAEITGMDWIKGEIGF